MSELLRQVEAAIQVAPFLSEAQRDDYRIIARSISDRVATNVESRLSENLVGIVIFPDAKSLTEYIAQSDDRARQIQLAGLEIIGFYERKTRRIFLSAEPWDDHFTLETRARNLGHELGHALDGPGRTFSGSEDWQRIFRQEIRFSRLKGRPLLDAGEAFSEVLSIILTSDDFAASEEGLALKRAIQFISEQGLINDP